MFTEKHCFIVFSSNLIFSSNGRYEPQQSKVQLEGGAFRPETALSLLFRR